MGVQVSPSGSAPGHISPSHQAVTIIEHHHVHRHHHRHHHEVVPELPADIQRDSETARWVQQHAQTLQPLQFKRRSGLDVGTKAPFCASSLRVPDSGAPQSAVAAFFARTTSLPALRAVRCGEDGQEKAANVDASGLSRHCIVADAPTPVLASVASAPQLPPVKGRGHPRKHASPPRIQSRRAAHTSKAGRTAHPLKTHVREKNWAR